MKARSRHMRHGEQPQRERGNPRTSSASRSRLRGKWASRPSCARGWAPWRSLLVHRPGRGPGTPAAQPCAPWVVRRHVDGPIDGVVREGKRGPTKKGGVYKKNGISDSRELAVALLRSAALRDARCLPMSDVVLAACTAHLSPLAHTYVEGKSDSQSSAFAVARHAILYTLVHVHVLHVHLVAVHLVTCVRADRSPCSAQSQSQR